MEIRRDTRIKKLMHELKTSHRLHLKDAAQLLDVSEMTIRRDLNAEPSPIMLLGGYIVMNSEAHLVTHYFVAEQKALSVTEKRHIGRLAAESVRDNEVIFFDCGTTIPFIVEMIPEQIAFTAVCYSLNTFLALQNRPNCKVILCGGEFNANIGAFMPLDVQSELDIIRPTKAFISAAGVSLTQGITCFTFDEIHLKKRALAVSQQSILVVDHTKWDGVRPAYFGDLTQINQVVTDRNPPTEFNRYFKQQQIAVHY